MAQFDIQAFCRKSEATWEDFARKEKKDFPENELLLRTPKQINQVFKEGLDRLKLEAGISSGEVYVSDKLDGRPSVNFGETLLSLEIVFSLPLHNIAKLSQKWRNKDKWFPFEQKVKEEYDRCMRLYQQIALELDLALSAHLLPHEELVKTTIFVEKEYRFALRKHSALSRNMGLMIHQKQAITAVINLRNILQKLKNISSRQA